MRLNFKALESYAEGSRASQAVVADKAELIQMLFDGLVDSLSEARGHIEHRAIEKKSQCLNRASRIVIGLKSALDFEQGGELSRNLDELYDYVIRKILHVNIHNDVSALLEIHGLMSEIQQAWKSMPGLISARVPVQSSAFTGSAAVH
jgi:flagellar protein FliS